MTSPIRLATRGSRLALWQAEHVANLLNNAGFATEIVPMQTTGDAVQDRSLAKIGSKGVFTEELEESLRRGETHLAVHSAKDVQSSIPRDLELLAFLEREQVNDVVLSFNEHFELNKSGIVLGTSSTRRKAQLRRFYPGATTAEARGNLQTRIRKLEEGQYDGLVLAYAGVHRMGYDHLVRHTLPTSQFVPATGQGSIAIECLAGLAQDLKTQLKAALDHPATHTCLAAERAFLHTMEGGCSIPSFALATLEGDGTVRLHGGLISLDGEEYVEEIQRADVADARALGVSVADAVLARGGREILASIREHRG
ncbi:hydroxymethylbilane synthase [Hymenobacter sp. BT770]|uniref:hydroxymethylbilane synthase n=1 Tax=Hymenobacter sp. BT770 TaxID=2886942 RepID=UPI001D1269A1|nr:hydroxymethylbilane synthase [Hymenobacter sp. BT770]MCC3151788.1 hydroxymethylbilane synthase [Hymenobacter sp. BT770]MDO3413590.1 hydroxymethylbilane synthase [Hymenobacter sp. BT770]